MKSSHGSSRQQKNLIRRDCLGSHARLQMVHVHVTQVLTAFKRQVGVGDDGKGAPSWHLAKEELVAKELDGS